MEDLKAVILEYVIEEYADEDDDVNYVKKLFNRAPAQFLYLFELALVELEEKGILNIKP